MVVSLQSFQTSYCKPLFAGNVAGNGMGRSGMLDDGSNTVSSGSRSFQVIHLMDVVSLVVVSQIGMGPVRKRSLNAAMISFTCK